MMTRGITAYITYQFFLCVICEPQPGLNVDQVKVYFVIAHIFSLGLYERSNSYHATTQQHRSECENLKRLTVCTL